MRLPLAVCAAVACLAACSSESEKTTALPPDALVTEASAASRDEVGVTQWAIEDNGNGDLRGYDAEGNVVVDFQHATQTRDGRLLDAYALEEGGARAHVIIARDDSGAVIVLESTFGGRSARIAELMTSDLRAAKTKGDTALAGSSIAPQSQLSTKTITSLTPLDGDLVQQDCVNLVNDCNAVLVNKKAAESQIAAYCLPESQLVTTCAAAVTKGTYKSSAECTGAYDQACANGSQALGPATAGAAICEKDKAKVADCKKKIGL